MRLSKKKYYSLTQQHSLATDFQVKGPITFLHVVFLTTCAFPIGPKSVTQRVPNFCYIPTSAKQPQKLHTDLLSVVTTFQKPNLYCSAPKIPLTVASSGAQSALSRRKPPSSSSTSSSSPASRPQSTPTKIVLRESIPFWQKNWFIALIFVMTFAFFALSVFLFLNLDLDQYASFSSASAASSASSSESSSSEAHEVTYGTVLKLAHEKTKFRLHSHDVPYGSGSGQQSVTGFPNVDDANSYWIVRPEPGMNLKQGDAIESGTIIRLQHMRTRKWLHSHLHASPISGNLEVSCFGGENDSDTGDYWRLMIEGSGKTWKQDQKIRLHHVDTGGYLHSHDKKYQRIAGGQQEVCAVKEKRADNIWLAAEGVYLPTTGST